MTCAERCELLLVTVNDLNPSADLDKNILVQLNEPTQDWHRWNRQLPQNYVTPRVHSFNTLLCDQTAKREEVSVLTFLPDFIEMTKHKKIDK